MLPNTLNTSHLCPYNMTQKNSQWYQFDLWVQFPKVKWNIQRKELPGYKIGLQSILFVKYALPTTEFIIFVLDISEWPCW